MYSIPYILYIQYIPVFGLVLYCNVLLVVTSSPVVPVDNPYIDIYVLLLRPQPDGSQSSVRIIGMDLDLYIQYRVIIYSIYTVHSVMRSEKIIIIILVMNN